MIPTPSHIAALNAVDIILDAAEKRPPEERREFAAKVVAEVIERAQKETER